MDSKKEIGTSHHHRKLASRVTNGSGGIARVTDGVAALRFEGEIPRSV